MDKKLLFNCSIKVIINSEIKKTSRRYNLMDISQKEVVQSEVEVKNVARLPNNVLEIPSKIGTKPFIKKGSKANVFQLDTENNFYIIYEFSNGCRR